MTDLALFVCPCCDAIRCAAPDALVVCEPCDAFMRGPQDSPAADLAD